jgi:AraC family transcriptional regulator
VHVRYRPSGRARRDVGEWPEFDKDEALDMGNDYIRTGLRRIAEELVSPGFASINQIECSLLFIAAEILRVFHGGSVLETHGSARFGRRELSQLCEMVIDPNGEARGLSELAAELGMCSRTLATTFRRTTGRPSAVSWPERWLRKPRCCWAVANC